MFACFWFVNEDRDRDGEVDVDIGCIWMFYEDCFKGCCCVGFWSIVLFIFLFIVIILYIKVLFIINTGNKQTYIITNFW